MESNKDVSEKKKFSLSLKPIKRDENKKKIYFDKMIDYLMIFNLFPYFNMKEAKELGKINIRFYNCFVQFYERAYPELIKKYNIILENLKDYEPLQIYEQKNDKGHFIKLGFFNIEHFSIFSYNDWTWKNDTRYWNKITPKNSILNKDIYKLKTVCWVDVNTKMSHIYSGKYKLYLNHCVCNIAKEVLKLNVLIDGVSIQEFIYPSKEQIDRCREAHSPKEEEKKEDDKKEEDKKENYQKKEDDKKEEDKKEEGKKEEINNLNIIDNLGEIADDHPHLMRPFRLGLGLRRPFNRVTNINSNRKVYNSDNSLFKEFIMEINVVYDQNLDKGEGHELIVKFEHANGDWKNNWLIDAVILEKINEDKNE